MTDSLLRLEPSAFDHFYLGGANIAALRGNEPSPRRPEEWLGSTVTRWGQPHLGLSEIDTGTLRDAIEADPEWWLGAAHVERWGANPAVLVKLLDAGQRLPVHVHPTRAFARNHLDCPFGKTEAWVVLEGEQRSGTVYVGTNRPVAPEQWAEMVADQATEAMLALLNPIEVGVGDAVVVPSGTPHCTGEGVFVLELQEPTDFSLLLEWEGFAIDGRSDGHLDLGYEKALDMVRRDALSSDQIETLVRRHSASSDAASVATEVGIPVSLMPAVADPYFRAWSLHAAEPTPCLIPEGFGILLIVEGAGAAGATALNRGEAWLVPHAARPRELTGSVRALFAQPPDPGAPEPLEWDQL